MFPTPQSPLRTALLLLALCGSARAALVEEIVELPVTVTSIFGRTVERPITVTVFRDDARAAAPFLLLNHGRPASEADFVKMGRVRYSDNAQYFVERGFAVFVPTRLGYGVSGGDDVEYSGSCSGKRYPPVYEAAARQSVAVIDYARALPYVDARRGIVVGQSFGGATAVALAAKNPPGVTAAINFAGGGGGNPATRPGQPCRDDLLAELFAGYGETARIPTLWLYSENDKFFGIEHPRRWFEGFVGHGGRGEFVLLPPFGDDGHASFSRNPSAWRAKVEQFLAVQGF